MAPKARPPKERKAPIDQEALKSDTFHDPNNTGPRPTHEIPSGGLWSLYSSSTINAPPKYVYDALISVQEWKDWNSYITSVRITKHPKAHQKSLKMEAGTHMSWTAKMTPSETRELRAVCHYREALKTREDGHKSHSSGNNITRIRWTIDNANSMLPAFVLKTERVNEILETEDPNVTHYRMWQSFAGMQAKSYRKKYEVSLKGKFQDWCNELKKRAEDLFGMDRSTGSSGLPMSERMQARPAATGPTHMAAAPMASAPSSTQAAPASHNPAKTRGPAPMSNAPPRHAISIVNGPPTTTTTTTTTTVRV